MPKTQGKELKDSLCLPYRLGKRKRHSVWCCVLFALACSRRSESGAQRKERQAKNKARGVLAFVFFFRLPFFSLRPAILSGYVCVCVYGCISQVIFQSFVASTSFLYSCKLAKAYLVNIRGEGAHVHRLDKAVKVSNKKKKTMYNELLNLTKTVVDPVDTRFNMTMSQFNSSPINT